LTCPPGAIISSKAESLEENVSRKKKGRIGKKKEEFLSGCFGRKQRRENRHLHPAGSNAFSDRR
jgi:hypothetical protein